MALNHVLLEGSLLGEPRRNTHDDFEFFLCCRGGVGRKRRDIFTVEIWAGWSEEVDELRGARPGDSLLVVGHLRAESHEADEHHGAAHSRVRIRALKLKRIKTRVRFLASSLGSDIDLDEEIAF